MLKHLLFTLFVGSALCAQIPSYYNSIDFSSNSETLELALSELISSTHTNELEYTPEVWDALSISNIAPEDPEQDDVLLIYGYDDFDSQLDNDRSRNVNMNCTSSSCTGLWNREHVYPRSIATPELETRFPGPGTDAHSLAPADATMNGRRSNRIFTESSGTARIVNGDWYPGDEWRGDVARMMMYMHIRYPSQTPANAVADSDNTYDAEMPDLFLIWNAMDPVSELEINRNNTFQAVQGNRNPFIDNPYLATLLWGGPEATDNWDLLSVQDLRQEPEVQVYPNPTSDYIHIQSVEIPTTVTILNQTGQIVKIERNLMNKRILLPSATGIYFVVIEWENQKIIEKVIKE